MYMYINAYSQVAQIIMHGDVHVPAWVMYFRRVVDVITRV